MKTLELTVFAITTMIIAACGSSKKSTTSAIAARDSTAANNFVFVKPANGIYAPRKEELTAIQAQYKDVTPEQLIEGYTIYTAGACVKCHEAQSIYRYEEIKWKDIVDDMAQKARISDSQKDAVYKYVLAIKATQTK